MNSSTFHKLNKCIAVALLLSQAIGSPLPESEASLNERDLLKRLDLSVIKTTVTPSGQIIDWIPIESQGNILTPPALPVDVIPFTGVGPTSELLLPGVDVGPVGTVPVPRMSQAYLASHASKKLPPVAASVSPRDIEEDLAMRDLEEDYEKRDLEKRTYAGTHWYVNSGLSVDPNYGSQASYSLFKAFTQSNGDFSLLQTAVVRLNAQLPGNASQTTTQTLEAGWINYPAQIAQPHIFTYYTIDGYASQGPNHGGWNTDYSGWVQQSKNYYPGVVLTNLSTVAGNQYEVNLRYYLSGGAWYLVISGTNIPAETMGYYPASLFSNNTKSSGPATLANSSNYVAFYGEIYNSESTVTTTDMGSGKFASGGYKQSAYMHNMTYLDKSGAVYPYTAGFGDSNSSLWNHSSVAPGASNWGQYIYLSGPGAGGVTGG